MIDLKYISGFYPKHFSSNPNFAKHMVKEYIQLMSLEFLAGTEFIDELAFIGGTNLRLAKGIDRWSEDLDFDCKDLSQDEFRDMTDCLIGFLQRNGLNAVPKDKDNAKLTAYRRNIYFPQLLFDLELTGHKEERFLLKIEAQDQGVTYTPNVVDINQCGFYFQLPVPPDGVLLSMKIAALLSRAKGRDFYDTMFLMAQTSPDYDFLKARTGLGCLDEIKSAANKMLQNVDLSIKKRDFEHLLFNEANSEKILRFSEFINSLA